MITKRVARKRSQKSSFSDLVKYLVDEKGIEERVGDITITNCHSDSVDWANQEVEAIQSQNTRATGDKTYHLLISFAPGEQPSKEALVDIEEKLCAAMGYGEHQRISVAHGDTDVFHVHVAINKIHPERLTMHEPYMDFKVRSAIASQLEVKHGLERVDHDQKQHLGAALAADMEHHSGTESLISWMKRECLEELKGVDSWENLHSVLSNHNLNLKKQGNGFVFTSKETDTTVKASSVCRSLSKNALEKRLGSFQESTPEPDDTATAEKRYQKHPLQPDTTALYARYKDEIAASKYDRQQQIGEARRRKDRLIAEAREAGRLKRLAIKLMGGKGFGKRALYMVASRNLKEKITRINKEYRQSIQRINKKNTSLAWADWLKKESEKGDATALAALRHRNRASTTANSLAGEGRKVAVSPTVKAERTTKNGTVLYRSGKAIIRDTGKAVTATHWNDLAIKSALEVVTHRYGGSVVVNGSPAFQKRIVSSAVRQSLPVTFKAPNLEKMRVSLRQQKEKIYDRDTGRTDRRSTGRDGSTRAGATETVAVRSRGTNKPSAARVGTQPPPASQNRLRMLSQLDMVQLTDRSEVLLQGDVPGHLEQQGTQSNDQMRRDADRERARIVTPEQVVQDYIAEREAKRQSGIAIAPHKAFSAVDKGKGVFQGIRRVSGQAMALVEKDKAILVVPLTQYGEKRMKSLKKGEPVTINRAGKIQSRGRER